MVGGVWVVGWGVSLWQVALTNCPALKSTSLSINQHNHVWGRGMEEVDSGRRLHSEQAGAKAEEVAMKTQLKICIRKAPIYCVTCAGYRRAKCPLYPRIQSQRCPHSSWHLPNIMLQFWLVYSDILFPVRKIPMSPRNSFIACSRYWHFFP